MAGSISSEGRSPLSAGVELFPSFLSFWSIWRRWWVEDDNGKEEKTRIYMFTTWFAFILCWNQHRWNQHCWCILSQNSFCYMLMFLFSTKTVDYDNGRTWGHLLFNYMVTTWFIFLFFFLSLQTICFLNKYILCDFSTVWFFHCRILLIYHEFKQCQWWFFEDDKESTRGDLLIFS